ncbi:MAG: hypothetical protein ACTSRU_19520 [Candidatus Hodarchaeales archaeon]
MFFSSTANRSRPKSKRTTTTTTLREVLDVAKSTPSPDSSVKVIRYSDKDCPSCEATKSAWKKLQKDNPNWKFEECVDGECEVPEEIEGFPQMEIDVGGERKMLSPGWSRQEIIQEVEKLQNQG